MSQGSGVAAFVCTSRVSLSEVVRDPRPWALTLGAAKLGGNLETF